MDIKPKIAILLLVHNNEKQINRLIKHLSVDFDIFVHIDKRFNLKIERHKNVHIYKIFKTYHGSFNQIYTTFYLLKKAFKKCYERYILISGQDLPIKTNEEILDFFKNNNKEYIDCNKLPTKFWAGNGGFDRITKYWFDKKYIQNNKKSKYDILYRLKRKSFKILNEIKPRKIEFEYYGGANWWNLSNNCVTKIFQYLYKNKKYINRFKYTSCADEIFYQTIIKKIDGLTIVNKSLRYVDWESGPEYPKILLENDYEKIINSDCLFARKFDENVDKNIIEMVYNKLKIGTSLNKR